MKLSNKLFEIIELLEKLTGINKTILSKLIERYYICQRYTSNYEGWNFRPIFSGGELVWLYITTPDNIVYPITFLPLVPLPEHNDE